MAIKSSEIPFVMGQKVTANFRGENFAVCVRGWMKGQYVITDLPKVGGGATGLLLKTECKSISSKMACLSTSSLRPA